MSSIHYRLTSLGQELDPAVVDLLAQRFADYKVDKDLENCLAGVSLDRFQLPEDANELFNIFSAIVTKNWHPLYRAILDCDVSAPIGFDEFSEMCEVHAPLELQQARKKELQQALKFTTTLGSSIPLPQRFLDYADVTSTIAYGLLINSGGQPKAARFNRDLSYLWSMQCDLHMKRKRFAHCLGSTLFGVDFNTPKLHLGMADYEFLAAVKVQDKQLLKPLVQAGLTQEMLDQISSLVLLRKGNFQPIAEYFDSVKFNRAALQSNVDQTRGALNVLVTLNWHMFHRVLVNNNVHTYEQFLALCQEYAKAELEQAQTEEVQSRMCFVVTHSGIRKVGISEYRDLALTIAYVIAQHDPAFKIDGIDNEGYIVFVKRALLVKRSQGSQIVAEHILRLKVTKRNSSSGTLLIAGSDDELEPSDGQGASGNLLLGKEPAGDKTKRSAGRKPLTHFFHRVKWPTKDNLEPLLAAGLTEELIHTIAALPSYRDKVVEPIIDQIRELNIDRAGLQASSRARVAMKTMITLYWDPWHIFMCNNSVSRYDQFIAVCEEYAPDELENAKTVEVQSRLKFVVENGMRKPARSSYSDVALTIAYAIALHDSSQKEDDVVNRNYFKGIRNCLMSKRDQLALRMAKKLLNIDLKTSGFGKEGDLLGDDDEGVKVAEAATEYDSDKAPDTSMLVELVNEARNSSHGKVVAASRKRKIMPDRYSDDDSEEGQGLIAAPEAPATQGTRKRAASAPAPEPIDTSDSAANKRAAPAVKKPAVPQKKRAVIVQVVAPEDSDSDV